MSWFGINNFNGPLHWSPTQNTDTANDDLMLAGTLVLEGEFEGRQSQNQILLQYARQHIWQRGFAIGITSKGSLCIEIQQGVSRFRTHLPDITATPGVRFRITFAWDAAQRSGHVIFQDLNADQVLRREFRNAIPLPLDDLHHVLGTEEYCTVNPSISLLALSDEVISFGIDPSIAKGSMIATADGPRPIERLQLGDVVQTESCGPQPVRWISKSTVHAAGAFEPQILRAPFFGLVRDVVVAPHQRIMMSGTTPEYLFGNARVLAEVRHLNGHPSVHSGTSLTSITYYQLVLDVADCINVSGLWCASTFVHQASDLRHIAGTAKIGAMSEFAIPKHSVRLPTLQGYETSSLMQALSA